MKIFPRDYRAHLRGLDNIPLLEMPSLSLFDSAMRPLKAGAGGA